LRLGFGRHILGVRYRLASVSARSSSPLVLLVDDEPDQVEMYQLALELSGFDVAAAYTGVEALRIARARIPAALVLDIRLPDMSGWDVCAALTSDSRTQHIPVIILTAAASSTLPQQANAAGCAAYLVKPCFPDLLTRTVQEVIGDHPRAPEV
jgi:CheY-like chemotaxis protein